MPSIRKNKKEAEKTEVTESDEQQQRERSGTGSDASIPEIVVGGDNEKTGERDLEKASQRV
jgi:hypothetical protein